MELVVRPDVVLVNTGNAAVLMFAYGQRAVPRSVQRRCRTVGRLKTVWRIARNDICDIPRGWSSRNEAVDVSIKLVSNHPRCPR